MTPDQQAWLKKAHEGLAAARVLQENELYAFAAGRAYYAMFYAAEALLLGEGLKFSKHSAVIAAFGQLFAKTRRIPPLFHDYLIEGQSARAFGDYSTEPTIPEESAVQIQRAEEFVEMAERVLAGD